MRVAKKFITAAEPKSPPPLAGMSRAQYIHARLFAAEANEDEQSVIVAAAMETLRQIYLSSPGRRGAANRIRALVKVYVGERRSPIPSRPIARQLDRG